LKIRREPCLSIASGFRSAVVSAMRLLRCPARLSPAVMILALAAPLATAAPTNAAVAARPALADAYDDLYSGYRPDFIGLIERESGYGGLFRNWKRDEEEMRLSTERSFFTLNRLDEDARANALVEAALQKETLQQHREALKMYQMVIEKYPHALYRVSPHGIFVPAAHYCQRRILRFPAADLAFYRSLYDARARESYEQARRHYSLIGLSEIADTTRSPVPARPGPRSGWAAWWRRAG